MASYHLSEQYDLVPHDTLQEGFGLLIRRCDGLVREVSRDDALLLYSIAATGEVAGCFAGAAPAIERLVLDGVLDRVGDEATDVGETAPDVSHRSLAADVSDLTIALAIARRDDSVEATAAFVYRAGGLPATIARGSGPMTVTSWLGLEDGRAADELSSHWIPERYGSSRVRWIGWRHSVAHPREQRHLAKLYVGLRARDLPVVVPALICIFAQAGVRAFKFPAELRALGRPDKFVCYFESTSALRHGYAAIQRLVADMRVGRHVVPFTASRPMVASVEGCYLGWAVDPYSEDTWILRKSWRQHVADAVAEAIHVGRSHQGGASLARVKQRLLLDGIDPESWTRLGDE